MTESAIPRAPSPLAQTSLAIARLPVSGKIGLALVVLWILAALFGPMLAPYDVGAFAAPDVFLGASPQHWLGSDYLGRDVFSRLLGGARYTVGLALGAALLASATGASLALISAISGGWIDEIMSRFMDTLISIPSKIFALVLVAAFGSSLLLLLFIAAIIYVPGAYRVSRSLAVNIVQMDFIQAARARGEKGSYLAFAEILPNILHPVLTDLGLRFVFIVLLLSGLSFLGLGVQPPNADLGSLVRENVTGLAEGTPAILAPAIAIATLTIGANLLIDGLQGGRSNDEGR